MASGFVQRWKGKVKADKLFLGAGGIVVTSTNTGLASTISPTELAVLDGGAAAGITATTGSSVAAISAQGITIIPDTTFNSTFYLADPMVGVTKIFYMKSTVASSGTRSVATLTTGVGIYGSSQGTGLFDTLNFGSSKTLLPSIVMIGVTSTSWLVIGGAYNYSTVPLTTTAITLGTRT